MEVNRLLFIFLIFITVSSKCPYSEKELRHQVRDCLKMGNKYVRRYLKYLNLNPKKSKRKFDTCGEFASFRQCITPLVDECPLLRQRLRADWLPILESLTCACSSPEVVGQNGECLKEIQCFENQSRSDLVLHCNFVYSFNIKQKTRQNCHFLKQKIECKRQLIESSCGNDAADFGIHLEKVFRVMRHSKCDLSTKVIGYKGFRYSKTCPVDFPQRLERCEANTIDVERAPFYESNILIVDSYRSVAKKACRQYIKYKACIRPTKTSCPRGVKLLEEYNSKRRIYNLRMEYICRTEKDLYLEHMYCYQEVVIDNHLKDCFHVWEKIKPYLKTTTSFDYYCLPENKNVINIKRDIFKKVCGEKAASVMKDLIDIVFKDPHFMHMKYKPDNCSAHYPQLDDTSVSKALKTHATPAITSRSFMTPDIRDIPAIIERDDGTRASISLAVKCTIPRMLLVLIVIVSLL